MLYYIDHPAEADEMLRAANGYVGRLRDNRHEKPISRPEPKKYFEFAGQPRQPKYLRNATSTYRPGPNVNFMLTLLNIIVISAHRK